MIEFNWKSRLQSDTNFSQPFKQVSITAESDLESKYLQRVKATQQTLSKIFISQKVILIIILYGPNFQNYTTVLLNLMTPMAWHPTKDRSMFYQFVSFEMNFGGRSTPTKCWPKLCHWWMKIEKMLSSIIVLIFIPGENLFTNSSWRFPLPPKWNDMKGKMLVRPEKEDCWLCGDVSPVLLSVNTTFLISTIN